MSCVSSAAADVSIAKLTVLHGGCNIGTSQHRECLAAAHNTAGFTMETTMQASVRRWGPAIFIGSLFQDNSQGNGSY